VITPDPFEDLARFYDTMMAHVDYDHWCHVSLSLRECLPTPVDHLDVACGTGVLMEDLRNLGWGSVGVDLSTAMLRSARKRDPQLPVATANMTALPFHEQFHLVTCLFDSVNFLQENEEVEAALEGMARALRPGGVIYFDVVTERMVTEFFEGPGWTEQEGDFRTSWKTIYDRDTRVATTSIRVNAGPEGIIRERVYDLAFLRNAIARAGLELLAEVDADTWKKPGARATRVDYILAKSPDDRLRARLNETINHIRKTR
jgi:ubiquinone/menaquinone biosynthesis C-methylase UbiE